MFLLEDIERRHDGRPVLRVGHLALGEYGLTAVLGHNGSGKSTLMSLLARQDRPDRWRILLDRRDLGGLSQKSLARQVAYLPQRLPPVAGLTVRELVALGRFAWRGALGRWTEADHGAVDRAMDETGCAGFAGQLADTASGGERQRAWIAMLLAQESPCLLLDEPTAALDLAHAHEVMQLLQRISRAGGRRVVVILHDINLATRFADRIIALHGGEMHFDGTPAELLNPGILRDLYGIEMSLLARPGNDLPLAAVR